jgi:hypothetical protein
VIVYDENQQVIESLQGVGFRVLRTNSFNYIMIQRLEDFQNVIRTALDDLRYVVIADVWDVYLQSDPMVWMGQNVTKPFLPVTEAILHRDERWNRGDVEASFSAFAGRLMEQSVYCAGVMAGVARQVADRMLAIGLVFKASPVATADQAAYDLLLDMQPYRCDCQFTRSQVCFTCQVEILAYPVKFE